MAIDDDHSSGLAKLYDERLIVTSLQTMVTVNVSASFLVSLFVTSLGWFQVRVLYQRKNDNIYIIYIYIFYDGGRRDREHIERHDVLLCKIESSGCVIVRIENCPPSTCPLLIHTNVNIV